MSNSEFTVCVTIKNLDDNRSNVYITYPDEQPKLSISDMAKILSGGVSLLVKLANDEGIVKDYELMEEIITYLNEEFISLNSFQDAKIIDDESETSS